MIYKKETGITLIALVVTIIVLLILAGVTLSVAINNDGLISKSKLAKTENEKAKIIEQAKTDILDQIAANEGEQITESQLKTILNNYFEEVSEELPEDLSESNISLTPKEELGIQSNILLTDLYDGMISKGEHFVLNNLNDGTIKNIYIDETIITWQDFLDSDYSDSDWTSAYLGHGEYHIYYKGSQVVVDGEHDYSVMTDMNIRDYNGYKINVL